MLKSIRIGGLLASLLVAVAAPDALSAAPSDESAIQRIQQVIDQAIARPEAVGLSVAVARGDRMLVERGAGIANLETGTPVDSQTIFRIGSVTKQFTAAAILKLAGQKQLSLDDALRKHVPSFDTGGRAVTLRQLLNHTSGVPSYTSSQKFMTEAVARDLPHEQLLAYLKDVPFDFEPGAGWNYSNTGYYLLGMVIEAVSGKSYAQYLQDEFFKPLGLTRTVYASEREVIRNRAQGYARDPATRMMVNDALISMNIPGAAGALGASAGDLVRWQIALAGGRAVSADAYRQMTTSTVARGNAPGQYGFGLMINEVGGRQLISHGGGIQGFNSTLMRLPASDLHVAVISSSEALASEALAQQIIQAATTEAPLPIARTAPQPGAEAAVRRMLDEIARGEPNYDLMVPPLAAATRQQLPMMQPSLAAMGAVQSVTFVNVTLQNADVYDVKLANGSLTFMIRLDAQGRVEVAGVAPGAPPPAR